MLKRIGIASPLLHLFKNLFTLPRFFDPCFNLNFGFLEPYPQAGCKSHKSGETMAYIEERLCKDGKIRYRVQVRVRGYPTQTSIHDRKTNAKIWAQQTESALREGRHIKTVEAKKHTVTELIDRYVEYVLPTKPKNASNVYTHLMWWKQHIGYCCLADLTPALIAQCRDTLAKESTSKGTKRSPSTVVRYMAAFSHALTIACNEWCWIDDSPMRKVTKPREPRGRVRFLSQEEKERLLESCRKSSNPFLYPVVVLALATGMRQGEIMNLIWKDIDFEKGRITLHQTKNGERRVVPLVGHACQVLKSLFNQRQVFTLLVFPGHNPHQPMDLRFPWEQALKRADISDFRFHDLRHSAASYLAMNGASLSEIAEVLGHKTLQMVKRYAHLSEAHTSRVVASMNEKIFG